MSADLLRRAAKDMRETADAALDDLDGNDYYGADELPDREAWFRGFNGGMGGESGRFAAMWHPAVALAVAEILELVAGPIEDGTVSDASPIATKCINLARTYLGETP